MTSSPTSRLEPCKRWIIFGAIALVLLTSALGACILERTATPPWDTSVSPAFICPGDTVTVSWDTGGGGTVNVQVSSSPDDLFDGGYTSHSYTGAITANPVSPRTTFTIEGTENGRSETPHEYDVDIILPDRITHRTITVGGICSGGTAAYSPISMAVGDFRAEGVRVVSITNTSRFDITLDVDFGTSGSMTYTLMHGHSTGEFIPELGARVTQVTASPTGTAVIGVECGTRATDAPPITLDVVLTCDLMSASEPIMAVTSEPEGTPQHAFIITDTPPTNPTITTNRTANCRQGPNEVFDIAAVLNEGFQAEPNGRDWQATWWRILTPDGLNFCWVSDSVVDFVGMVDLVAVVDSPPTPAIGCRIYDESTPNDLYDTTCVPRACTDQDQPGGECTPP